MNQKSVIIVTIGIFLDKSFKFQPYVCNECHDLLRMSINLYIAILNIHGVHISCIINGISKSDTANLLNNDNLNQKSRTL